jgi:hypothetical protein
MILTYTEDVRGPSPFAPTKTPPPTPLGVLALITPYVIVCPHQVQLPWYGTAEFLRGPVQAVWGSDAALIYHRAEITDIFTASLDIFSYRQTSQTETMTVEIC